jgi:hypothetical protein
MTKKKINKVIENLNALFDRAERKRKVKLKHVRAVIGDLKQREVTIKKHLESEKSKSKIKQLTNELEVIRTQRKKGKVLLKDLQEQKKKKKG